MPRTVIPLSDTTVRNAKPKNKSYKLADGGGLYVIVQPIGSKLWRLDYYFDGHRKTLSFGAYPAVSLKDARERRDEARKLLANGADPGAVKKAQKTERLEHAANTFEAVAAKWFEKWETEVTAKTAKNQRDRLAKHIMPFLGDCPIADIDAPRVLAALRPLEARGTGDTLDKAKMAVSLIMRFAVQHGWAQIDPVPSLRGAFKTAPEKHMAAITDPVKFGQLLRDIDRYHGSLTVTSALKLLPLVFCRPGELRAMKWLDVDLNKAEWKYTASKTKIEHLVPLARQAIAILENLFPITGHDKTGFVFPGMRPGRMLSDAALNAALRTLGYNTGEEHTSHGFRATARTLLAEEQGFDPLIIEHQLGHRVPDTLGTAYNRTKYLTQRKAMMQTWADYLDKLKAGADVIPINVAA
jgi:integrase